MSETQYTSFAGLQRGREEVIFFLLHKLYTVLMNQSPIARSIFFLSFLLILLSTGCGEEETIGPDPNPEEFTTFDVEWNDNVVYFDSTQLGDLIAIDSAEFRYHFKAASPRAATLMRGDVLVIHGIALRKVTGISTVQNEIIVETEDAYLTDAIKNGRVAWHKVLDYEAAEVPSLTIDGSIVPIEKIAHPNGFTYKAKFDKYSYEISMNFANDDATVSCTITEEAGLGIGTSFKLEGTMKKLESTSDIRFAGGDITNVDYSNRNLKGTLTASMNVKQQTADYGFKIPVVLLKYPFLVGPIPVVLNVRLEWAVSAGIPLGGQANVAAKFAFDSETGFSYNGTELTAKGQAGTWSASTEEAETGAVGATFAEFAIGFPQVEVDIFFKTFVPYARTTFLVRGDYSVSGLGGQSCQTARATFAGIVGARLSALGLVKITERQFQVWAYDKELLRMGECD